MTNRTVAEALKAAVNRCAAIRDRDLTEALSVLVTPGGGDLAAEIQGASKSAQQLAREDVECFVRDALMAIWREAAGECAASIEALAAELESQAPEAPMALMAENAGGADKSIHGPVCSRPHCEKSATHRSMWPGRPLSSEPPVVSYTCDEHLDLLKQNAMVSRTQVEIERLGT